MLCCFKCLKEIEYDDAVYEDDDADDNFMLCINCYK